MAVTRTQNGQILYNGFKMEMFVPDDWFKSNLADESGSNYMIFGAVRAYHYTAENQTRKQAKKSFLYYPAKFTTSPSIISVEKIDFGKGEEKYRVFTYFKDSVLFTTDRAIQTSENIEYLFNLLMNGKLDIVKYSHLEKMVLLCKHYNNVSFHTPAMYEETIISDYYRDPNNVKKPARFAAAVSGDDFYAEGITQRNKVSFISTFSGLSFEDVNSMITLADNTKRNGKKEIISDVEQVSLERTDKNEGDMNDSEAEA